MSFQAAIDAAVAQRRARLGDDHDQARARPDELRALALAERFAAAWPGGLVVLKPDWRADVVALLRGAAVAPLPDFYGDGEPGVGPLFPVAHVQCWTDEGCTAEEFVARYGERITQPRPETSIHLVGAPDAAELAALVEVLGPWAADEVSRKVELSAFQRWERTGGPEPCMDAVAASAGHTRFSGRVRVTPLHPNRFWRVDPEHGPRCYVRFWPAPEGGQPQWAWHLKGSGGWSRGQTGCFRCIDEAEIPRLTGRDKLARQALEWARLREPAVLEPTTDETGWIDRIGDEVAVPAEQLALFG